MRISTSALPFISNAVGASIHLMLGMSHLAKIDVSLAAVFPIFSKSDQQPWNMSRVMMFAEGFSLAAPRPSSTLTENQWKADGE